MKLLYSVSGFVIGAATVLVSLILFLLNPATDQVGYKITLSVFYGISALSLLISTFLVNKILSSRFLEYEEERKGYLKVQAILCVLVTFLWLWCCFVPIQKLEMSFSMYYFLYIQSAIFDGPILVIIMYSHKVSFEREKNELAREVSNRITQAV